MYEILPWLSVVIILASMAISVWGYLKSRKLGYILFLVAFLVYGLAVGNARVRDMKNRPRTAEEREKMRLIEEEVRAIHEKYEPLPPLYQGTLTSPVLILPFGPALILLALILLVRQEKPYS